MTLDERIYLLTDIIDDITSTNSLVEKRNIIDDIPSELKDDFECIVECLSGVHKFGYTYSIIMNTYGILNSPKIDETRTVRDVINFLLEPAKHLDLSNSNIARHVAATSEWSHFFEPIVNRTLKIGIGKSILPKDGLSAMLAKKYEDKIPLSKDGYFITEKLDGNRCIARYDGTRWVFTSRNGKEMYVNFDMSSLPKEFIYDGEIMSPRQTNMSEDIYNFVVNGQTSKNIYFDAFNETSGLINRHSTDKNLIYNIFDIMVDNVPYIERRQALEKLQFSDNTRLVKSLAYVKDRNELDGIAATLLGNVTDLGGEGIMINLADRTYLHKRTDGLLKLKKVQTMDMKVINVEWGSGKYEGQIGALLCELVTDSGMIVTCKVGSGLSDEQRFDWAIHPESIIGKIVEIGYFSLSQSSDAKGSNYYSLRFPRLKSVRNDKNETSIY